MAAVRPHEAYDRQRFAVELSVGRTCFQGSELVAAGAWPFRRFIVAL